MSSAADGPPARGRIDPNGRLVSADAALSALQQAAGSEIGKGLAVPQLAALARSAQSLMIALSRSVIAADEERDLDLWVRAEPDMDGVTLTLERIAERPPAPARLDRAPRDLLGQDGSEAEAPSEPLEWAVDSNLSVNQLSTALELLIGADEGAWNGTPLTRLFRLVEDGDGQLPLLAALAARDDFQGQKVEPRAGGGALILSGTALVGADGRFAGFRGRAMREGGDEAAHAAEEAAELLDEAIDSAMRSPLDLIIDAADRIVERSDGPLRSDYANYASDIAAAGRHLLDVIRTMGEQVAATEEKVDLVGAVVEAIALVRPAAEARSNGIELDHPERRLDVTGERRGVVQIIVNILGNAIRHSPDGGTVAVVFDDEARKYSVTVADQGPGIAEADQARIFERYEQSGQPEMAAQGTGLGLAISRRLARSMGGDVRLRSAPGEGARFTLSLDAAR